MHAQSDVRSGKIRLAPRITGDLGAAHNSIVLKGITPTEASIGAQLMFVAPNMG